MATIANQGDISYLMPQLKEVMTFLYETMVTQMNEDKKRKSFSIEIPLDDSEIGQRIAFGTADIIDWIRNQEKMVQQAKMVDELGSNLDVTFVDKGNPKSMDTITDSIQELIDEKEKDEDK